MYMYTYVYTYHMYIHTVVWFKLVVGNIHEKNFRVKKISS